jgi:hypothetical protein
MQWWVSAAAMATAMVFWLGSSTIGSLTVRIEDHLVQPVVIAIRGPVERDVFLEGAQTVTVAALPEGHYQVRPVFAGTVIGAPLTVIVGRGGHTQLDMPLGDIGGVRFDADPGMCEPEHPWSFIFSGMVLGEGHPERRSVGDVFMPEAKTCQPEVAGLAPGAYWVRVTPNSKDWPPSSTFFRIEAGQWTTVRIAVPDVIVRGRITSSGEPMVGVHVGFSPTPETLALRQKGISSAASPSITDNEGRYVVALDVPGTWRQFVESVRPVGSIVFPGTGGAMAQGEMLEGIPEEVTFGPGININDLELGGGNLRVWFTERGAPMPADRVVTMTMQSLPTRPREVVVTTTGGPHQQRIITPGRYLISATAQSQDAAGHPVTLVSARQQEVIVTTMTTADVSIDLVERDAIWLEVLYADGTPSEGAYVVPYPGSPSLRADDDGRVSLDTVPVGTRLSVRTRMFGITCHIVTPDPRQRVVVEPATAELFLTTPDAAVTDARRVLGGSTIAGVPGATCAVPFEGFSSAQVRLPDTTAIKLMVPPGVYTLTLRDGRTLVAQAPGRVDVR